MENIVLDKSKTFALRIIKLYSYLQENKKEFIISKQLFRSGTSIGANVSESHYASSRADFVNKLHIALKEASETEYWIDLLIDSNILKEKDSLTLKDECKEIIKLLVASIKTAKNEKAINN